ncbi:unnamed protein product [Notodromas monacha]|uniref:Uncharacterized protein n=1 Tax=Notodromas monacha TaxID=399045 RepID=A0A7R9BJ41_9CRUS|nr:unnamed protein product [Notodromas monacha]CAG0916165.1 unnamed protein product [Notodromas monacha]
MADAARSLLHIVRNRSRNYKKLVSGKFHLDSPKNPYNNGSNLPEVHSPNIEDHLPAMARLTKDLRSSFVGIVANRLILPLPKNSSLRPWEQLLEGDHHNMSPTFSNTQAHRCHRFGTSKSSLNFGDSIGTLRHLSTDVKYKNISENPSSVEILRRGVILIGRTCRSGFKFCTMYVPSPGPGIGRVKNSVWPTTWANLVVPRPPISTEVIPKIGRQIRSVSQVVYNSVEQKLYLEAVHIRNNIANRKKLRSDVVDERKYWKAMGLGPEGPRMRK